MTSSLPLFRKLVLVFSAVYLSLIIHELGHVLAGTLAGFRSVACGIGTAQPFARVRIAGVRFYLARPILRGMTWALPRRLSPDRKALAILSAGGPLANLATGLVAWVVSRPLVDGTFVRLFVLCSLMMGIGNLVPFYSSISGVPTDGLTIVHCIRNTLFYDPAPTITAYERFFAWCKSLDARGRGSSALSGQGTSETLTRGAKFLWGGSKLRHACAISGGVWGRSLYRPPPSPFKQSRSRMVLHDRPAHDSASCHHELIPNLARYFP